MVGLDGMILFPNYKAGICSSLDYPDTCCLGQQKKRGFAPAHCVLHPDVWQKLRIDPTFIFEGEDSVAELSINLNFPDPINQGQDSWKTKVIILKYHETYKFQPGDNFKYSNEDIKLLRTYSVYQTPKSIKCHVKKNFDIFLV